MSNEHRELSQGVDQLKKHIQGKIELIETMISNKKLPAELGQALIAHNRAELNSLQSLRPGTTLKDVINNHFVRTEQRSNMG